MSRKLVLIPALLIALGTLGWTRFETYLKSAVPEPPKIPTTLVKRGDVQFDVSARGELRGGSSEMLVAPMTGGREMVVTQLGRSGELVEAGDVVAQFDTTEQEFNLREAQADSEEADQQLVQAKADSEAKEEEARYALIHAKAMVQLAELDVRKNPLIGAIEARQNVLALEAARDQLNKLQEDLTNRKATNLAGIAIQEAARNKAKVKADMAQRNIDSMTLKARTKGYISVENNSASSNIFFFGMQLPQVQIGDTVRAGMPIAQIPDLEHWEVTAQVSELDRGHLAEGNRATVKVVALAGRSFPGKVKSIGGTGGPPWNRTFEVRVALDKPVEEMRPGMSADILVTTGELKQVLWIPSQALFQSDGRSFVYVYNGASFQPADVKMVQRSESQIVIEGITEGKRVALANPAKDVKKKGPAGVMQAVPKG